MKVKHEIILCFVSMAVGSFLAVRIMNDMQVEKELSDMYLAPPKGQMQGMDPNDLSVRQAFTSTLLRQTCMKIQQDVQGLIVRMDKVEDPNN